MGTWSSAVAVDEGVDPNDRSPQLGLKYKDLAVLGQLMKHGADLSQSRTVICYSYAPSHDAADAIARAAEEEGFASEVHPSPTGNPSEWSVVCQRTAVLSPDFVRDTTDLFEGLAERFRADYDGWEAAL
jgi:regulator of ribonuclease activity B